MRFRVQNLSKQSFIFILDKRIGREEQVIDIEETSPAFKSVVSTLRRLEKSGFIKPIDNLPLIKSPFKKGSKTTEISQPQPVIPPELPNEIEIEDEE